MPTPEVPMPPSIVQFNIVPPPDGRQNDNAVWLQTMPGEYGRTAWYRLTTRQFEILQQVCTNPASGEELSKRLDITEQTLKSHLGAIYKEFGIPQTTAHNKKIDLLVATLVRNGILEYLP